MALYVCYRSDDRKGVALHLQLMCSKHEAEIGDTYSSPTLETSTKPNPFTINDTLVLFFNRLGLGQTAVKELCGILGIPVMQLKTFQKKENKIIAKAIEVTNEVIQRSAAIVREMHFSLNPDFPADQPVHITVSFDGTWQKRRHTSMYGVAAVIEIVTGLDVDYVVLSTYCHSCSLKHNEFKGQAGAFDAW